MATSLAKQLEALSVPQTSRFTKEHAVSSLLFEPKYAAELERDDIYVLALNGLEELEGILPIFYKFRSTIFGEQSKSFERSVKSKDANQLLNKEIESYLRILSPFVLLKPAQKTLEWLIRRFQIHLYNCDALMKCVLLYHESKIFVRVVQILDLKISDSAVWRWLTPLQKSGMTLSKQTLLNACCGDMGLLNIICQIAKETVMCEELTESCSRTAVSFYLSTVLGILKQSKDISEDLLTVITPHLVSGIKSTDKDYVSASYFILVYLTQKIYLDNTWFERLFTTLLENVPQDLESRALNCFAVCFLSQNIDCLSSKCCKLLLKTNLRLTIEDMAASKTLTRFLKCLTEGVVELAMEISPEHVEDVKWLLKCINFSDKNIRSILSSAVQIHIKINNTSSKGCLKEVINIIQTKYATVFDQYCDEFSSTASSEDVNSLFEAIGKAHRSAKNFSVNSDDDLILYLNHPCAAFRKRAVQMLETFKGINSNLENILLARLKDDDPAVVLKLLSSSKLSMISSKALKRSLLELSSALFETNKWSKVAQSAMKLLINLPSSPDDDEYLVQLLPLLFPLNQYQFNQLKSLVSKISKLPATISTVYWSIFKDIKKCINNMDKFHLSETLSVLIEIFSHSVSNFDDVKIDNLLKGLTQNGKFESADCFKNLILPLLITDVTISSTGCIHLMKYFSQRMSDIANLTVRRSKYDFSGVLEANSYVEFFTAIEDDVVSNKCNTLCHLTSALVYAVKSLSNRHCQHPEQMELVLLTIMECTVNVKAKPVKNICKLLTQSFIASALIDPPQLLTLLMKLLSRCDLDQTVVVRCLNLLKEVVASETCHEFYDSVLFMMLPCCNSQNESIREAALDCLTEIEGNFMDLIEFLLQYRNEIQSDYNYLTKILKKYTQRKDNQFAISVLDWMIREETNDYLRLGLLSCLDKINSPFILDRMLNILKDLLTVSVQPLNTYQHSTVQKILGHINSLSLSSYPDLDLIMDLLSRALLHTTTQLDGLPTIQELALQSIKKSIFNALPNVDLKRSIIKQLLELRSDINNVGGSLIVSRILRKVLGDGAEIAYHLERLLNDETAPSTMLRELAGKQSKDHRNEYLVILESIEGKSDVTDKHLLIPVMFKMLKQSLDAKEQNNYELELVASCLLDVSTNLSSEDLVEQSYFNIDLLIKCLQRKSTPRFHGSILLILSAVAQLFPEFVLRNAMNVFTLMSGGSLLHQDDSYSFGIILATLDKVLPSIFQVLQASVDQERKLESVSSWIRIFVDALPDILAHRRLPLLKTLLSALGSNNEWLWLLLATVLELYVSWDMRNRGHEERKATVIFAVEFCCLFSPTEQISAAIKLCDELTRMLKSKKKLLWMYLKNDKQKRTFSCATVAFISSLFGHQSFLKQLVDSTDSLSTLYQDLTRAVFTLLNTVQQLNKVDDNPNDSLVNGCFQLIEKTVAFIPVRMFIKIVDDLLETDDVRLQCKVIDFFPKKLQHEIGELQFEDLEGIYRHLLTIIKHAFKRQQTDQDTLMLQQLSLLCCKYLAKHYAKTHRKLFQKLAKMAIKVLNKTSNDNVISSALLCVAELCISLEAHFIVYLNDLIPVFMTLLEDKERISKNELLLGSLVTLLSKLVECQQSFLSPHLDTVLLHVCNLCTIYSTSTKSHVSNHLGLIRLNLSRKIELRILFPAVKTCFKRLVSDNAHNVVPLMHITTESLRAAENAVSYWNEFLSDFFFQALDYRSEHKDDLDMVTLVEKSLFEPILVLVLKMSEVTFKSFFLKFFNWATITGGSKERVFTFYNLTDDIADKLKSLFVLFAGDIILHMISLLESNNSSISTFADEHMNDKLLNNVFDILYKCFVNDTQGFINNERYEALMTPLVDQLDNESGDYADRLKHLIPCLSNMTQAVTPDVNLQLFVNQILYKTRSSSSKVKCAALESIRQIAKKINEDFMSLLPETVPVLSELLEDDDLEVVSLCQSVVVDLEIIVGEPLQNYFNNPSIA
ncbi:HEAT repeat-containing protein 1 [Chamberlinius hualienensis]